MSQQVASVEQVHRWVARRLPSTAHEQRVLDLAVGIYGLLQTIHRLPPRCRRMLKIAALTHDVGRYRSPKRHHIRGARIIAKSRYLTLAPEERTFAAYAARHHRGPVPSAEDDQQWNLNGQARPMRALLAILRAADALDKRRLTPPTILLKRIGYELRITVITGPTNHAAFREALASRAARRKFRMLREELDIAVKLKLRRAP